MILDRYSLAGKAAIVTGPSSGIGQSIALALAEAGADVFGTYNRNPPTETGERVRALGRRWGCMQMDMEDPARVGEVVDAACRELGAVHILVNNAGCCPRGPAEEFTPAMWDETMDVNLKSAFFLSQRFARQCFERGLRGKIINLASMLSVLGGVNAVAYTASKHGVAGITKALANEWAARGINVNAIAPGWIRTNLSGPIQENEGRNQSIIQRTPAGDWGLPEALQGAAVFLASEASDFIHGAILPVDGGYLVR